MPRLPIVMAQGFELGLEYIEVNGRCTDVYWSNQLGRDATLVVDLEGPGPGTGQVVVAIAVGDDTYALPPNLVRFTRVTDGELNWEKLRSVRVY